MIKFWVFLIMLADTTLGAIGSIMLKKGAHRLHRDNILEQFRNYELLSGIFLFAVSVILFLVALKVTNLSILYPITSLTYVWIALLSSVYLHERINKYKLLGIILIIVGIIFITLK